MDDQTPQQWAETLREALTIEGESVPFDRALKRHLDGLSALRSRGLTWPSLANILRRSGVQRPDGKPYSADHIRVSYDRLIKGPKPEGYAPRPQIGSVPDDSPIDRSDQAPEPRERSRIVVGPAAAKSDSKDVSDDELSLIAARLNKSKQ